MCGSSSQAEAAERGADPAVHSLRSLHSLNPEALLCAYGRSTGNLLICSSASRRLDSSGLALSHAKGGLDTLCHTVAGPLRRLHSKVCGKRCHVP